MTDIVGKALREEVSRHAVELVSRLGMLLRNAELHDPNNATWKPLVKGLVAHLGPLLAREKLALVESRASQFLVNKNLIPAGFADFSNFKYLGDVMERASLGAIEFRGIPEELELKRFAYALVKYRNAPPDFRALEAELAAGSVKRILVTQLVAAPQAHAVAASVSSGGDPRVYGVYTFLKGISAVQEIMDGLRSGRSVGFKRAKRFVQSAVDLLDRDRALVAALTTIKEYGDYLYNHSVNVCLLSLLVGAKLGFDRTALGDLGLAALLRDVGKAAVPKELLEKEGKLDAAEWQQMRAFPYAAVLGLLRFRGFNEGTLRQVIVAFEHKFKDDLGAGSSPIPDRELNLYSRIAQLADMYDAMTTPRPYRPRPFSPDQALRNMITERHKTGAHPALLKTFIHALGLYPVGSVVMLDTNEVAVVAAPPHDMTAMARPRVRLVSDPQGNEYLGSPLAELTEFDEAAQRYERSIALPLDRWKYGINVARHLLSDETL